MACAVLPVPLPNKAFWAGDADHLVDDLIAACQSKPVLAPSTGFGRELVPFCETGFDDGLSLAPPSASSHGKHARQPSNVSDSKQRPGDIPSPDGQKKKRSKVSAKAAKFQEVMQRPAPASPPAASSSGARRQAASAEKTAPGFQTSPKPESLPMPTTSLLLRASASRSGASSPVLSSAGGSWSGLAQSL